LFLEKIKNLQLVFWFARLVGAGTLRKIRDCRCRYTNSQHCL